MEVGRNYPWILFYRVTTGLRGARCFWVGVDRLTKSAHFLPIRKDYPNALGEPKVKFVRLFILRPYGHVRAFTIQNIRDMLRSCALDFEGQGKLDDGTYMACGVGGTFSWRVRQMSEATMKIGRHRREKLKEGRTRQKSSPTGTIARALSLVSWTVFEILGARLVRFHSSFGVTSSVSPVTMCFTYHYSESHEEQDDPFVKNSWRIIRAGTPLGRPRSLYGLLNPLFFH
ncbi:hypothetical protein Tco_0603945 [Tanacetum coccineum]